MVLAVLQWTYVQILEPTPSSSQPPAAAGEDRSCPDYPAFPSGGTSQKHAGSMSCSCWRLTSGCQELCYSSGPGAQNILWAKGAVTSMCRYKTIKEKRLWFLNGFYFGLGFGSV